MKCFVEGCEKDVMYKKDCLCQMHYFRRMRNGSFDLVRARKYRHTNPAGYHLVFEPSHPLAQKGGYVYEHRFVLFNAAGRSLTSCVMCGAEWSWDDTYFSHVDHINNDKSDNRLENLRPLCNACNTRRDMPAQHTMKGNTSITHAGKTMTASEWAREPGVLVCGPTITRRLASGMSVYDALFSSKRTHNGNVFVDNRKRKTEHKHERSNSIPVTIDGLTMTAAEWSRHPDCTVTDRAIINRVRSGMDHKVAVFSPPNPGGR